MALLKSMGRMLANTVLLPVDLVRDIVSINDPEEAKPATSYVVERSRRWTNSMMDIGVDVADTGKVVGSQVADISKVVGNTVGSTAKTIGGTIQDFADGKSRKKEELKQRIDISDQKENTNEQV